MRLIEDKNHFGFIMVASVKAKKGCIFLSREKRCGEVAKNDVREQEIRDEDAYEGLYPLVCGRRMLLGSRPIREKKIHSRLHENMKTMPDCKIQRMNRGTLRQVIGKN